MAWITTRETFPEMESFLTEKIGHLRAKNPPADELISRIERETSTRILDWVDHIVLPESVLDREQLAKMGYEEMDEKLASDVKPYRCTTCGPSLGLESLVVSDDTQTYLRENSVFPAIPIGQDDTWSVALRVENLGGIRRFKEYSASEGIVGLPYQQMDLFYRDGYLLSAVERRGYSGFIVHDPHDRPFYMEALRQLKSRPRNGGAEDMGALIDIVEDSLKGLSTARLADAFIRAERLPWRVKNPAASWQHGRQMEFSLGWENHDFHVFRSSRAHFRELIDLFMRMGFRRRERMYGDAGGGWGAQVMEHPEARLVVVAEVDLDIAERDTDFSGRPLSDLDMPGAVGIWIMAKGESLLEGGMYQLAARFDLESLARGMSARSIGPFLMSRGKHMDQALIGGEPLAPQIERLVSEGIISQQAARKCPNMHSSIMGGVERRAGFAGLYPNLWEESARVVCP